MYIGYEHYYIEANKSGVTLYFEDIKISEEAIK